mmetsp:Transcript_16587/g.38096  ORF Transcript_16587/g.38096 Transcript_16587/m.38096 type:complete len:396 (+) Transcript_16587:164-1351(+)|eukprot:CAMPEP_0116835432 /NCGR_PEP_ID=MMETSP0418-20121206/7544_1 /TAXON_ID=1158023 /ORGANISM="Astrosyne radiata, Strain 13vi08-1A" /LENGTH=395 /DNA_ID=CAMNT_0004465103 /DNA_START=148 /DNA_END=1335 /DNA_ORIENTATION=-
MASLRNHPQGISTPTSSSLFTDTTGPDVEEKYIPPRNQDDIDKIVNRVDQKTIHDKYRPISLQPRLWSSSADDDEDEENSSKPPDGASSQATSMQLTSSTPQGGGGGMVMSPDTDSKRLEDLYQMLEDDYYPVKQKFAYLSILITSIQILVLMLQLSLCGVAPLDVNPFVGPYPDGFWGIKNAYLIKDRLQLWRLVTPAFEHVGVIHLLINAAIQLETCAFFEREWGSLRYGILYVLSETGCVLVSCVADPDTIAVGSSGALLGLFGAKLSQVLTQVLMDSKKSQEDSIRLEQLSSIMCSLAIIFLLSFFTYVDWSGHMGAMATGFCTGMVAFSNSIRRWKSKLFWQCLGILFYGGGTGFCIYLFLQTPVNDALGDACQYFRNLFDENHDCGCLS